MTNVIWKMENGNASKSQPELESTMEGSVVRDEGPGRTGPYEDWERKPPNNSAMILLPATVKGSAPMSIVPESLEALMSPQFPPFAPLMTAQPGRMTIPEPLSLLMPSERRSLPPLMAIQVMVAIIPLRFSVRSASDA
jgi:hypothetical protein